MFRELSDDDSGGYRQYGAHSDSHGGFVSQVQQLCSEHRRLLLVAAVVLAVLLLVVIPVAVTSRNSGGDGGGVDGGGQWTNIAGLPVYEAGSGARLLLYLPDINGRSSQALQLVHDFAAAGFRVLMFDYFDGGTRNSSHTQQQSLDRARAALSSIREQQPTASIQATGYCWGGGVGVSLTSGSPRVDGSVVAHAAGVSAAMVAGIQTPISFVMPQTDPSFNLNAPVFFNITLQRGIEAQFRVYPNVSHGFAVATPSSRSRRCRRSEHSQTLSSGCTSMQPDNTT